MKTSLLSVILPMTLGMGNLHANLGESEKQIETRYGKPKESNPALSGDQSRLSEDSIENKYEWHGFTIEITLVGGRSEAERVVKADAGDFSDEEVATLLKANDLGRKWMKREDKYHFKDDFWTLDNGSAFACVTNQKLKIGPEEFLAVTKAFNRLAAKRTDAVGQRTLFPVGALSR